MESRDDGPRDSTRAYFVSSTRVVLKSRKFRSCGRTAQECSRRDHDCDRDRDRDPRSLAHAQSRGVNAKLASSAEALSMPLHRSHTPRVMHSVRVHHPRREPSAMAIGATLAPARSGWLRDALTVLTSYCTDVPRREGVSARCVRVCCRLWRPDHCLPTVYSAHHRRNAR